MWKARADISVSWITPSTSLAPPKSLWVLPSLTSTPIMLQCCLSSAPQRQPHFSCLSSYQPSPTFSSLTSSSGQNSLFAGVGLFCVLLWLLVCTVVSCLPAIWIHAVKNSCKVFEFNFTFSFSCGHIYANLVRDSSAHSCFLLLFFLVLLVKLALSH